MHAVYNILFKHLLFKMYSYYDTIYHTGNILNLNCMLTLK